MRYVYASSQLTQVIDRFGHTTTYTYNNNGLLIKVSLPTTQTVNGQTQTFDRARSASPTSRSPGATTRT